jgi:hypothetical protein
MWSELSELLEYRQIRSHQWFVTKPEAGKKMLVKCNPQAYMLWWLFNVRSSITVKINNAEDYSRYYARFTATVPFSPGRHQSIKIYRESVV